MRLRLGCSLALQQDDAIGNLAVVLAAGGVWSTSTAWPDPIVAGIMASLFLYSSIGIVREAVDELGMVSEGAEASGD